MEKETDIRALLLDHLKKDYSVENCASFSNGEKMGIGTFYNQLILRNFNADIWWSNKRQSAFIESIFMGCELPLIIVFEEKQNDITKYLLVDGLNRIVTIQNFLNDKLRISPKSIKTATFLKNKIFSELEEDARDYFCERGLQILKYSFAYKDNDPINKLTKEDLDLIAKQLYFRYNSGIQLKIEEIQKADYQDDEVTIKLATYLKDQALLEKLKMIYFTPQKNSKTFLESTLMYARLAITSCYTPIELFCKQKTTLNKIDFFYRDYTAEVNKEIIVNDFLDITSCLYELVQQKYWKEATSLHNQYFMLCVYWLLFYLKKFHLLNLAHFDWQNFISYFQNQETTEPLFSIFYGSQIDRYQAIINYMNHNYHINLQIYLPKEIENHVQPKVTSFKDLPKYNFQLAREGITIDHLLQKLKNNRFILRPSYQRHEINNIEASSCLIESLFLGINIPDILVYKYEDKNNRTIFEVVDGQQRCLSFLGYQKLTYQNQYGEDITSEKNGFALKGLSVCSDLNGQKYAKLPFNYQDKIKNGQIRIVYIPEKENPYFSVKDYFTNLNKTIIPLKKNSYRYWNVCYDEKIMKKVEEIVAGSKYEIVLPRKDFKYTPHQIVVILAYLFYHSKLNNSFSIHQVTNWLENFNIKKSQLHLTNQEEEIAKIRQDYFLAFDKTDQFLTNIHNWLTKENKTIYDLIQKKNKILSSADYICLYYLLSDINSADLMNNSSHIYQIIFEYYNDCLTRKLTRFEKMKNISKYKDRLSFCSIRDIEKQKFHQKMNVALEKI